MEFLKMKSFNVIDNKGNIFLTTKDDEKYISGEVKSIACGTVAAKLANNQDEKLFRVSVDDERLKTGELIAWSKNKILAKDKNGKVFYVDKYDERYISGTLTPFWVGKKHKEETINKVKQIYKEIKHQQGEKNSQYGTCWVTKDNENKKIKKEELDTYIQMGWIKGRKIKK